MSKKKRYVTDLLSIVIPVVLFASVYRCIGMYYAINDDITMQRVASGATTGTADGHIVFIRYFLGAIIAGLFDAFPGFDWYGMIMQGLILVCCIVVIRRILRPADEDHRSICIKVSGFLILVPVIAYASVFFQFTVVAGVLGAASLFLLASASRESLPCDYVLSLVFFLMSYMIRVNVAYITLPLIAVIIAGKICHMAADEGLFSRERSSNEKKKKLYVYCGRLLAVTIIGLAVYGGIRYSNQRAYGYEPWATYSKYKHARSLVMDYYGWPDYSDNKEFWDEEDISEEEYDCLSMYALIRDFDSQKMIDAGEYAEENYSDPGTFSNMIRNIRKAFEQSLKFKSVIYFWLITIALLCMAILTIQGDRHAGLFLLVGVITELVILVYILNRGRFPDRVAIAFLLQCTLSLLGFLLTRPVRSERYERVMCSAIILLGAVLTVAIGKNTYDRVKTYRSNMTVFEEAMDYLEEHSDNLYVTPTGVFSTVRRFTVRDQQFPTNSAGTRGWSVYSPWNDKKYEDWGIDTDGYILLDPRVYMLVSDMKDVELMQRYYLSEGIGDIEYNIMDTFGLSNGTEIYSVKFDVR